MAFDPDAEPCGLCGRDLDECICTPDDLGDVLDEDYPDIWDKEIDDEH